MPLSRRHGLFAFLLFLFACVGDEGAGPRPIPSALEIAAGGVQTGVVAQPLDSALTVRVLDQNGEPLAGVLVQFVLPTGAGSLSHLTRTTGPDGQAATVWTLPQTAGDYATIARVAELDSVSFSAAAGPAAAAQLLVVAGDSQWTTVGLALDSAVRVRLVDPFGNGVPGQSVSFLIMSGGGNLSVVSGVTDSLGQAETRWTLGSAPAVGSLRASVAALAPVLAEAYGFPVQRVDSLAFGPSTCHLPAAGGLRCWGPGASRPLGTGDTTTAFTPVTVPLAESFISLHGGDAATCGITSDGTAWCWGQAIGLNSDVPVQLTHGPNWRELVIGGRFTNLPGPIFLCGLSTVNQGYCWGLPGPLGNGDQIFRDTPTLMAGGHRWRDIDAGYDFACGVSTRAIVYCWGANGFGQLGNGTTTAGLVPVPILGSERYHAVTTAHDFACALTLDGRVRCWGRDAFGNTGLGGGGPISKPVDNSLRFVSVRANNNGVCGITTTGETHCWGHNQGGNLGLGPQYHQFYVLPTRIVGDPGLTQLAAGDHTVCGTDGAGDVWCWGSNALGNVGVGDSRYEFTPDAVISGPIFTSVVAGTRHTCGLTATGEAWCWGSSGTLAQSVAWLASVVPVPVQGGLIFTALSATSANTCGLSTDGGAYCWGFGPADWINLPTPVPGGHSFSAIAAGSQHFCGITAAGPTVCWGQNLYGQLGDSTLVDKVIPVPVSGGHLFAQIVAGAAATCGIDSFGAAYCWGHGSTLGDDTSGDRPYPGPVSGGLAFQRLAAPSGGVACGITPSSDAWCWGLDAGMRFGNGSSGVPQPVPVPVSGGYQFSEISVGARATCGVTTGGTALCWGDNSLANLGTGDTTSSAVPVPVASGVTFARVATGAWFSCAVEVAAGTRCWGFNPDGELGNGESSIIPAPRKVQ